MKDGEPTRKGAGFRWGRIVWWAGVTVWLTLCVLTLANYLSVWEPGVYDESQLIFVLSMATLAFPSGYAYLAIAGLLSYAGQRIGWVIDDSLAWIIVNWTMMVVVGFLQWFVLCPWLFGKIRSWITG